MSPAIPVGVLLLGGWQAAATLHLAPAYVLPAPVDVARALTSLTANGDLPREAMASGCVLLAGLGLGAVLGGALGYLLATVPAVERGAAPWLYGLQAMPKVALAPVFVLWLGLGAPARIALVAALAFFPVMVNLALALRSVPADVAELLTVLRATRWQRFRWALAPAAAPAAAAGLKLAAGQAIAGVIVAEWMAPRQGLGYLLLLYSDSFQAAKLVAVLLTLAALGVALYGGCCLLERRALHWQAAERRPGWTG